MESMLSPVSKYPRLIFTLEFLCNLHVRNERNCDDNSHQASHLRMIGNVPGAIGMAFELRLHRFGLFAFSGGFFGGILKAIDVPGNIERDTTKELQIHLMPVKGNQGPAARGVIQGGLDCSDGEWCLLFPTDRGVPFLYEADNFRELLLRDLCRDSVSDFFFDFHDCLDAVPYARAQGAIRIGRILFITRIGDSKADLVHGPDC